MADLTKLENHFFFGENWTSFSQDISDIQLKEAHNKMRELIPEDLNKKTFLDIGCGSGIHAVAALKNGIQEVQAIDIDPSCVKISCLNLKKFAPGGNWAVNEHSIFDEIPSFLENNGQQKKFDIVYSWGVLHHTGDLEKAIEEASKFVKEGGVFVFALYRRTWSDFFWKAEKRWFTRASKRQKEIAYFFYDLVFRIGLTLSLRSYRQYVENYHKKRGMNYRHDLIDWLGGWPYEPISPVEVFKIMDKLGFKLAKANCKTIRFFRYPVGFSGSGCDEYCFIKA